jgi:hypothetical protein
MAVLGRSVVCRSAWLVLVLLASAGCRMGPDQWGPFRGQIVDAETGAPIPGAHFMVMWERDHPNPVHWTQSFYDAQEAVTDADGRFEILRQRRFFTLLVNTPRFDAFAPGYVAESSEVTPRSGLPYVDATVLKMRLQKTREERCKRRWGPLADVRSTLPNIMAALDLYTNELKCWELVGG